MTTVRQSEVAKYQHPHKRYTGVCIPVEEDPMRISYLAYLALRNKERRERLSRDAREPRPDRRGR
ncbi:hypothetical protein Mame01_16350 [Microbispora amethystogenes]|nr:hypothetical protein Mame01_16350 [Microbispora amethystogenes]